MPEQNSILKLKIDKTKLLIRSHFGIIKNEK